MSLVGQHAARSRAAAAAHQHSQRRAARCSAVQGGARHYGAVRSSVGQGQGTAQHYSPNHWEVGAKELKVGGWVGRGLWLWLVVLCSASSPALSPGQRRSPWQPGPPFRPRNNNHHAHPSASIDPPCRFGDGLSGFSNYGRTVAHIAAPGENIMSTLFKNNDYGYMSGTSMATPIVSGDSGNDECRSCSC